MNRTPRTYSIHVKEPYLSYIMNGVKTVEGRLNKGKFLDINSGDLLIIDNSTFIINETALYPSFLAMVRSEGFKNVIPDMPDEIQAANVYYNFFTKEQENTYGVKALRIAKIAK